MGQLAPPLTDLYAPIDRDLLVVQRVVETELASELPVVEDLCARLRTYHGKMLRPALLLLVGQATGRLRSAHHTLAAVVEIVHMATLVHDDVLDEADERRSSPTMRMEVGNVAAVLLGDYLISHAYHLCSSLDSQYASRRIGAATNTVCEGELLQNVQCHNGPVSEADYFEVIRRKTGTLTAVSCELGAHVSGAEETVVAAMRDFGMKLGVAFQIIDDVLDVVGQRRVLGKTLGRDFALGKPTLPTIHCLTHAPRTIASRLRAALAGESPGDAGRLRGWLDQTGSIDYARDVASGWVRDALDRLEVVPESEAKASLTALAEFIIRRRC